MKYLAFEEYKKLYLKYLEYGRSPEAFLKEDGDLSGKIVIDLCCGNGRLGNLALKKGANTVYFVDGCLDMMTDISPVINAKKIVTNLRVQGVCPYIPEESVDVIFCQQAINYVFCEYLLKALCIVLKQGGKFIFNTFKHKPPSMPQIDSYHCDGYNFTEVSWSDTCDNIYHVQIREGRAPHSHSFKYFSQDQYSLLLSEFFTVECKDNGKSLVYICQKK